MKGIKRAKNPSLLEFLEAVKESEKLKDLRDGLFSKYGGRNTHMNYLNYFKKLGLVYVVKVGRKTLVNLTEEGDKKLEMLKK